LRWRPYSLTTINLPGIVGSFLAELAVNVAVHENPAREKVEFLGNSLLIPIFFLVTGFLIDPAAFVQVLKVAATLAATLVAFRNFDPTGQRLLDTRMLNVVLVLVLTASILGPVLTERFAPRLLSDDSAPAPAPVSSQAA
jgi:hypothetical protein